MSRKTALPIALAVLTIASVANAASPQLKGQYAFTGSATCMKVRTNIGGTGPNAGPTGNYIDSTTFQPKNSSNAVDNTVAFMDSFAVEGVRTFNGDGTGSAIGVTESITLPAKNPAASSHRFSFKFHYLVPGDGTWTSTMDAGTYSGTFTAGPRNGQTITVDQIPLVTGLITVNSDTLTAMASLIPAIETHMYSNGDVDQAVCQRSRVLIRLQPSNSPSGFN